MGISLIPVDLRPPMESGHLVLGVGEHQDISYRVSGEVIDGGHVVLVAEPFNLELVNFFGPLIKTKHVMVRAIFDFSTKKPLFFVSGVQECRDFYELDIFISEYFPIELNLEMEAAINNCLGGVIRVSK